MSKAAFWVWISAIVFSAMWPASLPAGTLPDTTKSVDIKSAETKASISDTFPLRAQYRVPVITTAELSQRYDQVVIVDVRSKYEYETLRVKDALHISVTDRNFVEELRALRDKTNKPIVFYCNGKTCHKSYDAVVMATRMQIADVLCYDAGIADWAKAQPNRTALFGNSPIQLTSLISAERFKEHLLDPKEFEASIGAKALVVDVRDRAQRDTLLFPGRELRSQLDDHRMLGLIIEKAKQENKTLLIYDQVGKQVEWFQYYLESRGVKDYYFMKGGAKAYYDATHGNAFTTGKIEPLKVKQAP